MASLDELHLGVPVCEPVQSGTLNSSADRALPRTAFARRCLRFPGPTTNNPPMMGTQISHERSERRASSPAQPQVSSAANPKIMAIIVVPVSGLSATHERADQPTCGRGH